MKLDTWSADTYNVCMTAVTFIWDEAKNRANQRRHRVSFEEAKSAFYDEGARVYFDPEHSDDEDSFILLGISARLRVLVVCHCYRESESVVRIISARQADKCEESDYWS